ncbi:STAS domain-containing protein [Streptomyces humidus]|uniref:STAS domain-containing protein n=1 Tax=Streptomyces humidus TaxID=52259 RepID=UPI00332FFFA1
MPEPVHDANAGGVDGGSGAETIGAARQPRPATGVVIRVRPEGDRVVVALRGELDLESTGQLERALYGALGAAVGGVDLELDGVAFCDCAALNVLLGARERGLREGKTVAVHTVSPAVRRLLDLTGTGTLFGAPASASTASAPTPSTPAADARVPTADTSAPTAEACSAPAPAADALDEDVVRDLRDLRVEVVRLRRAMQTRPVIDLARGILMASFGLGVDEAWRVLSLASSNAGARLHRLAGDLVLAVQDGRAVGTVHDEVAAAVARVRSETAAASRGGGTARADR